jgi:hypothetical protein
MTETFKSAPKGETKLQECSENDAIFCHENISLSAMVLSSVFQKEAIQPLF